MWKPHNYVMVLNEGSEIITCSTMYAFRTSSDLWHYMLYHKEICNMRVISHCNLIFLAKNVAAQEMEYIHLKACDMYS
jgi:hypothetical protein